MSEREERLRAARKWWESRQASFSGGFDDLAMEAFEAGMKASERAMSSEEAVGAVINVWNEVAKENGIPTVKAPGSYVRGVRVLLKEEGDLSVLREAFTLFASQPFIQENRYGLSNFIPNRSKYIDRVWFSRRVEEARAERSAPTRMKTLRELAEEAGMTEEQYRDWHRMPRREGGR